MPRSVRFQRRTCSTGDTGSANPLASGLVKKLSTDFASALQDR
jgi:hypothetical protein